MAVLRKGLVAESQPLDDLLVFLLGALLDEVQQLAALGNKGQQATARREVLLVDVQVVREVEDPPGEQGHLIRGAAGVSFVELIVFQVDFFGAHGRRGWIQQSAGSSLVLVGGAEESRAPRFCKTIAVPTGIFLKFQRRFIKPTQPASAMAAAAVASMDDMPAAINA